VQQGRVSNSPDKKKDSIRDSEKTEKRRKGNGMGERQGGESVIGLCLGLGERVRARCAETERPRTNRPATIFHSHPRSGGQDREKQGVPLSWQGIQGEKRESTKREEALKKEVKGIC